MIAELIPALKLKRQLKYFDYKIPEHLNVKVGDLVLIEFRKSKTLALVQKIKTDSSIPHLKSIIKKVDNNLYNANYIKVLNEFSKYLFISPSLILHNYLLYTAKIYKKLNKDYYQIYKLRKLPKEKLQSKANKLPLKKRILIVSNSEKENFQEYLYYIKAISNTDKKQKLILFFPNLNYLERFLKYLDDKFIKENIAIISNALYKQKNLFLQTIQNIKKGKTNIIIGTRSMIFLPIYEKNDLVIFHNAEHQDYKQEEMNPRYQTIDLAYLHQKIYNYQLVLYSLSPRILDYYLSQNRADYILINKYKIYPNNNHWINLKYELFEENKHPLLSLDAENKIIQDYKKGQNSLILHNRKGYSQYILCKNCNQILECPNCSNPLRYNKEKKLYYCPYCHKEYTNLLCPHCNSKEFNYKMYGIEHLAQYLQNKYPQINIEIISKEKENLSNKTQITIATNYIFSILDNWQFYKNIILTNAEQLLNIQDFNSHWHNFIYLNYLIQHSAENNIHLFIQHFNSNFFIFKYLKNNKIFQFYKKELEWRKELKYPPYKQLIKILFKNKNLEIGQKEIKKIYKNLKNLQLKELDIYPPYQIQNSKRYGEIIYQWLIINKIPYKYLNNTAPYYQFLNNLDSEFLIDINPERLYK